MAQPRRQARGLARIEAILDAAAAVVAESGPEALSMNEVARRAGISPGSLYQFFSDKRALLVALTERFAGQLGAAFPLVPDDEVVRAAPLPQLLDTSLTPVLDFLLGNPGYRALFVKDVGPFDLMPLLQPVHDAIIGRLEAVIAARAPSLHADGVSRVALMCELVVRGALPAIGDGTAPEQRLLVAELRTVLLRYLEPIDEAGR
jgi:AcrR family transcriptional regulator